MISMKNNYIKWEGRVAHFLSLTKVERIAQLKKWNLQSHSLPVWTAILSEEVGELSQEVLRQTFNPNGKPTSHERLVAEAIEVAAVALAIAQCAEDGSA